MSSFVPIRHSIRSKSTFHASHHATRLQSVPRSILPAPKIDFDDKDVDDPTFRLSPTQLDSLHASLVHSLRQSKSPPHPTLHLVAFSGGVDSSLAAHLVLQAFGPEQTRLCLGKSPSLSHDALLRAQSIASHLGAHLVIVETKEGDDARYVANDGTACFYCKSTLYATLQSTFDHVTRHERDLYHEEQSIILYNGTNADDVMDVTRVGLVAAREYSVQSPVVTLSKAAVRALARHVGLPNWDHAASPCLRSRLAIGVTAESSRLGGVEAAEAIVKSRLQLGPHEEYRVRLVHGGQGNHSDHDNSSVHAVIALNEVRLQSLSPEDGLALTRDVKTALMPFVEVASVKVSLFRSGALSGHDTKPTTRPANNPSIL